MKNLFRFLIAGLACGSLSAHAQDSSQYSQHSQNAQNSMTMASPLGPFAMTRDGSGTSWQPDVTPMIGKMWMNDDWMLMAHGMINFVYDNQGGERGDSKAFASSMAMLMASRPLGAGTFGLRGMVSLDPLMGKSGYPLLLQTGETANGKAHLIDRQHPHDAFMELATTYSVPIGERDALYVYLGLPGEPALGPSAFMHRFSGMENPEAPLTHHWLDSTHVTFGVATLGYAWQQWKIEGSIFNGREPDQYRWNIETRHFDSASSRISFNPNDSWSLQVSNGYLKSPEQLDPDVSVHRTTASATYHQQINDANWQTTFAWGKNDKEGNARNGYLLESTYAMTQHHTFFGRGERVANDELFDDGDPLHGRAFTVNKLSLGYIYDFAKIGDSTLGIGGLLSTYWLPGELRDVYGEHPLSSMVFVRLKL